jgi:hypothetical protein
MRKRLLLSVVVVLLVGPASRAGAPEEPRAILAKAIRALGGEEQVAKLRAVRRKAKGTQDLGGVSVPLTFEEAFQFPGQYRLRGEGELGGRKIAITYVRNGDQAWRRVNDRTEEFREPWLTSFEDGMYSLHPGGMLPEFLKDQKYTLSPLPPLAVEGRPTVGVKVAAAGRVNLDLYFDAQTGLLLRSDHQERNAAGQMVPMQTYYRAYCDSEGVKQPMKVLVQRDGRKKFDMEVIEVKVGGTIAEREFAKP